jgi:hypothetical protein
VATTEEASEALQTASSSATALQAPVVVRTYIEMKRSAVDPKVKGEGFRKALRALLADPFVKSDPLSASTVRLLIASPAYRTAPPGDAKLLLEAVIREPGLPLRHPLKIAAMLAQANVLAQARDPEGARVVFDRTGLTTEQCALVGLQPALKHSGADSSDYPAAAARLGFEGWVLMEYDITADGRTATHRVVTAYPPFIFDEAATGISRTMRYAVTYRPPGGLACSGERQSIVFRIE